MTGLLLILFVVPVEGAALWWAWRRSGFIPFPHGLMLYLLLGQVALYLHAHHIVEYSFVRVFTTYAYIYRFNSMFLMLSAMFFALLVCVPATKIDVRTQVAKVAIRAELLWLTILAIIAFELMFAFVISWRIVWMNANYLQMTSPDGLRLNNALGRTVLQLFGLVGLIAWTILTFTICTGRIRIATAVAPLAAWHLLYAIAAHSRTATLYLTIAAVIVFVLGQRKYWSIVLFLLAMIVTTSVLWGRITNFNGFASLPFFFENVGMYFRVIGFELIGNLFEGLFVTAEYFHRDFRYDETYKILSLSPLFSFIDGFDAVRETSEIRLNYWVPNSAVSEVLSFGPVYAAIFFGSQLVAGRMSVNLMARRPGLLPVLINAYIFLTSYQQFAYSTRTVYRSFVYAILFCLLVIAKDTFSAARVTKSVERRASYG